MGANRAQRRRQERETLRDWKAQGKYEQLLSIQRNGITAKDLDTAREEGYRDGYMYAAEGFMRKMYAAIAKELLEAGNSRDDVVAFVTGVDHKFAVMFDADEEIQEIYDQIGVLFNVDRNAVQRIEEV